MFATRLRFKCGTVRYKGNMVDAGMPVNCHVTGTPCSVTLNCATCDAVGPACMMIQFGDGVHACWACLPNVVAIINPIVSDTPVCDVLRSQFELGCDRT